MSAPNTSATGGYLAPLADPTPTQDDSFDDQLQEVVVGITGIAGNLVRPRWQENTPKQPDRSVNWCAIGIVSITSDDTAFVQHNSTTDVDDSGAYDELQRHEIVEVLVSFYGPGGRGLAELMRDGLSIAQNREAMFLAGMGLVDVQPALTTGELVNQGFIRRVDLSFRFRRIVVRHYPVLNIRSAEGAIVSDHGSLDGQATSTTPFEVTPE